ncbi:MAG: hypothetical protein JNK27_05335 [Chitinophagaceae bacterium]|nr:hypothetical protein [Chitinophagaceae bacterium]
MNNTYILLRNNSESTPLNLEDLKRIGLLPTDLLWVECQSVCWQRPQEIPELRQLLNQAVQPTLTPVMDEAMEKYTPPVKEETPITNGKKGVYVELPPNYNSATKKEKDIATAKQENKAWQNETTTTAQIINMAHTNNSGSLNEIQQDTGTKELPLRQQPPKDKTEMLESLLKLPGKKIALYAGLIISGALMMLVIRGTGGKEMMRPQPVSQLPKTEIATPVEEVTEEPVADSSNSTPESYGLQNTPLAETITERDAAPGISASVRKTTASKNAATNNEPVPVTNEQPAKKLPPVTENKEVKKVPVENITSKLQLKPNEYTVAAFGGIRNLKMTLQNDSRYLLDKVSVELRYLNPEGKVVKTETIDFNFVQPGAEATVAVKKTSRGIKLDYKITHIESKELAGNNSVAGENINYSKN